jgi:hypothetical protein
LVIAIVFSPRGTKPLDFRRDCARKFPDHVVGDSPTLAHFKGTARLAIKDEDDGAIWPADVNMCWPMIVSVDVHPISVNLKIAWHVR